MFATLLHDPFLFSMGMSCFLLFFSYQQTYKCESSPLQGLVDFSKVITDMINSEASVLSLFLPF